MSVNRSRRSQSRVERLRKEGLSYVSGALERWRKSIQDARDARIIDELLARGEPIPFALRDLYLSRNFERAARRYSPKPWLGRATLFRAEQMSHSTRSRGPAYGWDREILGGVEVVTVPGDHTTLVLGANAERLVRSLSAAIERAAHPAQRRQRTSGSEG